MRTGPDVGLHRIELDRLARLDVPVGSGAVVLGFDRARDPVPVQLFRARPTQVAMVAGGYAARLLAFRAHAVGARVQVVTPRPEQWRGLVDGGPPGRTVLAPEQTPLPEADTDAPVLRMEQGLSRTGPLDPGPWQARIVVQDVVAPQAVPALRSFDLVLVQRLQPDVVHPLQSAFGLPDDDAAWLPRLPDDTIAVVTRGRVRLTALGPTPQETAVLGAPDRHDW